MKHDRLPDILDCFAAGLNYEETAKRCGCTSRTIQRYIRRSYAGDPEMICTWQDVQDQFINHCKSARAMLVMLAEQNMVGRSLGHKEIVIFQGQVQYRRDPALVGRKDLQDLLGVPDDLLRINGEVQPLYIDRQPSDALTIKVMESHMRKTYGQKSEVDVKHSGTVFLPRPGDAETAPKQIEQAPQFEIEAVPEEDQPPPLALARPARDSAEADELAARGEFEHRPATYVDADGKRTTVIAGADPLLSGEKQAEVESANAAKVAGVDRDPNNPVRQAFAAELEAHNRRVAEQAKAGGPPKAPPPVPVFKPGPDDDIDDVSGKPVKAMAVETGAAISRAREIVQGIQNKMASGELPNAIERQALKGAGRGDWQYVASLFMSVRTGEGIGAGTVRSGGARTVG